MASQDARLSKVEADFKQQQSEMTNKTNTVLKAITNRIIGALLSNTVKNLKLNVNSTSPVLSAHSYPTEDPQCLTRIYSSINAVTICPRHDVMFIEIIKKNDDSRDKEPEVDENTKARELEVEYFDIFPTRSELAYHKYLMSGPIPSIFLRNPIITEGCGLVEHGVNRVLRGFKIAESIGQTSNANSGTIGTTDVQVLIDKKVDKEVQYYVYTLHVPIPFLNRLNDQADNTKPPLSFDTFGNNRGGDSETSGPVTPAKEVVDIGHSSTLSSLGIYNFVQPNAGERMRLQATVTGVGNVTPWEADIGRRKWVLCYVQGSGRRKRKKSVGCGSGKWDCALFGASVSSLFNPDPDFFAHRRILDPGINSAFQDNTLRERLF
ncbi:hypothetical protein Tco_0000512 [Tanacetum coccineum]